MENANDNGISTPSRVQGATKGDEALPANGRSRAVAAAEGKTVREIGGYMAVMSNLLLDVIDGTVDPKRANAACNVADKLLKAVELQMRVQKKSEINEADVMKVIKYLHTHENVAKPAIIALDLELDMDTTTRILQDERFERTPYGVRVATK